MTEAGREKSKKIENVKLVYNGEQAAPHERRHHRCLNFCRVSNRVRGIESAMFSKNSDKKRRDVGSFLSPREYRVTHYREYRSRISRISRVLGCIMIIPATDTNIARIITESNMFFISFLYRCERRRRMLLIVSSNWELEANGCSILLLCIADLKHGGCERTLLCPRSANIARIKPSEAQLEDLLQIYIRVSA